ncbi:MAG: ribonuclease HII [Candidatus Rokuibacteriota bacterium]
MYTQEEAAWARGLHVAGVDEAGRGPLAGPVVAAAVVLDPACRIDGLRDSKLCSARQRRHLARMIRDQALGWTVCRVGSARIDTVNILEATWRAMRRALRRLSVTPALVLVDGRMRVPGILWPQRAIVRGDRRCASIAAASILAKVARDAFMVRVDRVYPGYGFRLHKGYATTAHLDALARLGPCPLHRRSFRRVAGLLGRPVP